MKARKRLNPFDPLYAACNKGESVDKYAQLPTFPHIIDLELTSACNFRCLMCPTGNLSVTRPTGFMSNETFERIYGQCHEHGTALRFIGWGEPTLHPNLVEFVYRAASGGLLTHLNTNGSKLTSTLSRALISAGLASLKFSFQGVDRKSYREMRGTDFFDGLLAVAKMVREARGDRPLPYLHLSTTVTYEKPEAVADFKRRAAPLVDGLTIGKTIFDFFDMKAVRLRPAERAMLEKLKALETSEKKHPDPCPEVFDKLSIHWDGSVVVCCNAFDKEGIIGNVNKTPLRELWRHPEMEAYRERLARKEYSGPLCSVCWDYSNLTAV